MLTKIEIGGVDVSSYVINYTYENVWGDSISVCELKVNKNISNAVTISNGETVEVWRGWVTSTDEKIFDGYVETYNPEGGMITLVCKDKLWDAVRKEVTHVYDQNIDASAGKISEIFEDLIETYAGLNCDVEDSGTAILLDKFVCNHTDIFERCKNLAKVLEWQFYYVADDDKVYFEPQGNDSNANVLTVGSNIIQVPKWEYDITNMCNDLTLAGAFQEIETTESGKIGTTAGYATTGVDLSFVPVSVKVYGDASDPPTTLLVGGLPDSTASYDYYVDKPNKKIIPATGTTFTTDDYYEIRYSHAVPIPVHLWNQASIDDYGQFKKTVTYTDVRGVADAEVRATNYLAKYSVPYVYATIKVKPADANNFLVGQLVRVVDNVNTPNVNDDFVITRHRIRYPADYEELVVGDKTFRLAEWQSSVEERLKRIQEDELANQDMITEVITADGTLTPITFSPRYGKVLTQTADGTTLIWDHTSQGDWDEEVWGGDAFGSETNTFIMQYQNIYNETFIDTDFDNTVTTTATGWGTGTLSFTNGQIGQSYPIDFNNGTILVVTLTASSSTNLTLYASADGGSHFETVTSGTAHTFTNTGTSLVWKALASGVATLTSIKIENYH